MMMRVLGGSVEVRGGAEGRHRCADVDHEGLGVPIQHGVGRHSDDVLHPRGVQLIEQAGMSETAIQPHPQAGTGKCLPHQAAQAGEQPRRADRRRRVPWA